MSKPRKKRAQIPGISIRKATEKDIPAISAMVGNANREELKPPFNVVDDAFLKSSMSELALSSGGAVIAEKNGEPIGLCVFVFSPLYYNPDHKLAISFIRWLSPDFRGNGVGEMLISRSEEISRDLGAKSFVAAVRADGSGVAQRLLKRNYKLLEAYYVKGL